MSLGTPPAVCAELPPHRVSASVFLLLPRHLPGNGRWRGAAARPVTPGDRLDRFGGMSRKRPCRAGPSLPRLPSPVPSAQHAPAHEGPGGPTALLPARPRAPRRPQTCLRPVGRPQELGPLSLIPTCWRGCGPPPEGHRAPAAEHDSLGHSSATPSRVHHHQLGDHGGRILL